MAAVLIPYWWLSRSAPVTSSLPSAVPIPSPGGTLVASTRTDPRSFNRIAQPELATELFTMLTQAKLVRINRSTTELEPWLAEAWSASPDGRTYTLTLRDGLRWSDGAPFTADDVLFSFAALYDPQTTSALATSFRPGGKPLDVTAPDARTIVVRFAQTFGPGIRLLDGLPILPRHKLEAALKAGTFAKAWAPDTPPADLVGMGPFVVTEYRPAERVVFARNPHYWRTDARGVRLPYAEGLTLEIVPDQDAELVRLQAGAIDFMQQPLRAADVETLKPLEAQGKVQVLELGVSPDADSLVFNLRPERWAADPRRAWLPRKEFRQALSHAVDREAFANAVFLGAAVPIHGPVTPGNPRWFWPSIPRYEFSRDKALGLLGGLGLQNRDADEWLEDAQGTEARLTMLTFRGNRALERGAAVVRDALRQVGIAVDVVALDANAVRQAVVGSDFETAFITFSTSDPDPAMSTDLWLSSGGAHFWHLGQASPATEWERRIDDLMAQQAATVDEQERKRLFNEVQRIFSEHLPMLHFAAPRVYIGASARLVNPTPALTRPNLLWSADTLAIADARPSQ